MLIVSRNRGPWVAAVFIILIAIATFLKIDTDSKKEAEVIANDKVTFVPFVNEVKEKIGSEHPLINSMALFEFYRCGIGSNKEKVFCNRQSDEVINKLTPEQQKELVPVFKKFFVSK